MNVSLNIPEDLYRRAAEVAEAQRVSVEDVLASAVSDQLRSWEILKARAARGDRQRFLAVLDSVSEPASAGEEGRDSDF